MVKTDTCVASKGTSAAYPKVLIIKRHFWPYMSDATLRILDWCERLRRLGASATVLTDRPHPEWPARIILDRLPVVRLDSGSANPLRNHRFGRHFKRWMQAAYGEYDLVYFDDITADTASYLENFSGSTAPPVAVRFDGVVESPRGAVNWSIGGGRTMKLLSDVCQRAAGVVVPSSLAHQCLLSQGLSAVQVLRMEAPLAGAIDRSIGARRAARHLLGEASHDLVSKSTDMVVLVPGELTEQWNVDVLVQAAGRLTEQYRNLRVWILGDGPSRGRRYDYLRQHGWHYSIIYPGIFTDIVPLLQAADLCVFPGAAAGHSWLLPTCAASAIPSLVARSKQANSICGPHLSELGFEAGNCDELRQKLIDWLQRPGRLEHATGQLQNRILSQQPQCTSECIQFLAMADQQYAS